MVKDFRGQVKISEVKAEFDYLLTTINNTIDLFNQSEVMSDEIDFSNVSPNIAPPNYTLSVGGLKKILEAYNGAIVGCRVFRIGTDKYYITEGLLITSEIASGVSKPKVVRIQGGILNGSGSHIYYSPSNKKFYWDATGTSARTSVTVPTWTSNNSCGSINAVSWSNTSDRSHTQYNSANIYKAFAGTDYIGCLVEKSKQQSFGFDWVLPQKSKTKEMTISLPAKKSRENLFGTSVVVSTDAGEVLCNVSSTGGNVKVNASTRYCTAVRFRFAGGTMLNIGQGYSGVLFINRINVGDALIVEEKSAAKDDVTDLIHITKVNCKRTSTPLVATQEFGLYGETCGYITSGQYYAGDINNDIGINDDTDFRFISGLARYPDRGGTDVTLFGHHVWMDSRTEGDRAKAYSTQVARLFIPPKQGDPFGYPKGMSVTKSSSYRFSR